MDIMQFYDSDEDEQVFRENQMRDNADRVEILRWVMGEMDDGNERLLFGIQDEYEDRFLEVMWSWRNNLMFEMWWI